MTDPIAKAKFFKPLWLIVVLLVVIIAVWLLFLMTPSSKPKPITKPKKIYEPVVYQTKDWTTAKPIGLSDGDSLKTLLGDTATSEEALDFYGELATKYRYTAKSEPPLYVIESQRLFEIGWYYASATDDEPTKNLSLRHAQKAYQVMTALDGKQGANLMQAILDGKTAPKLKGVIAASCENYLCRIVIKR